jgi:general L-amino acid transport system substrate-binding protein
MNQGNESKETKTDEHSSSDMSRGQFIKTTGVGAAGVGAAMAGVSGVASAARPSKPPGQEVDTIGEILERGKLKVGVRDGPSTGLISWPDGNGIGNPIGFDPDLARALAAAMFGDSKPPDDFIEWVPLGGSGPNGRFQALDTGKVDVVFRAVSYTAKRDVF